MTIGSDNRPIMACAPRACRKRSIPALTPTMMIKCATRRSVSRRNPPPKLNRAETRVVGIRRSAGQLLSTLDASITITSEGPERTTPQRFVDFLNRSVISARRGVS